MGYFSNGTEGELYVERYCSRCKHWEDDGPDRIEGCPVWDLHILFAYEECNSSSNAKAMLDTLIPRGVIADAGDGHPLPINEQCVMFIARDRGAEIEGQLRIA